MLPGRHEISWNDQTSTPSGFIYNFEGPRKKYILQTVDFSLSCGHPKFSLVCMSPGVRFLFPMLDNAGSLVFPQALRCRRNVQP